ncbi:MAG: hypothetical protein K0R67_2679, partial [Paenibacillus sp.]|nr:hypothetical protein [Paenibacillus sp.]
LREDNERLIRELDQAVKELGKEDGRVKQV